MCIYHTHMQIQRKLSGCMHATHLAIVACGEGSGRGKGGNKGTKLNCWSDFLLERRDLVPERPETGQPLRVLDG